jgi:hydroxypyruvate reductase
VTFSRDSTRALLIRGFDAAVAAADPVRVLADHWPAPPQGRVVVLALGKAAVGMARAAVEHYRPSGRQVGGVVVAPHDVATQVAGLEVVGAGHPVPDAGSLRGGERLLAAAATATEDDLALLLISGGGSALASRPDGIELEQLAHLNRALLASGAAVREINQVRRRLDRVKAGGLAAAAFPARRVALIVSDVVGDPPLDIASGPASGDPAGPEGALAILDRYDVGAPRVRALLAAERDGRRPGPPRPDDPRLAGCEVRIVASAARSLEAARRVFDRAGFHARVTSDAVEGDARQAARAQAREVEGLVRQGRLADGRPLDRPAALLSGGETTVTVRGAGQGGRNSTYALALALALPDGAPVRALIADSDGVDGVGGHAGAFVEPDLFERLPRARAEAYDRDDDSRSAFAHAGALFEPGPTGTNVNDLRFVLVGAGDGGVDA